MMFNRLTKDGLLLFTMLIALAGVVGLSRRIDSNKPSISSTIEEDQLYLKGPTAKRISLCFNGLAADWYWMRSLQYVGRKVLSAPGDFQLDNVGQLNLKLLAPLLDTATTLDPQFTEPYEYAAVVLPNVSVDDAIRITKKGIDANPSAWRLYQQLGYIYWQQQDFSAAGESYGRGAAIPGAPNWMETMKARMATEGGSRKTAREIYQRMYEQAGDEQIKNTAQQHLLLIDSLDQRDGLRKVLAAYSGQSGRCPTSWRDLSYGLRSSHLPLDQSGAPLDPAGVAYALVNGNCDVDLGPSSTISRK
ncbi:MAG: hypothetical protein ABJC10_03795 [Acidobacteriota bacterium]